MKILMLESEHGRYMELKYASCVAKEYAKDFKKKATVIEVERPAPVEADAKIRRYNPDIIWFVGHGYVDRATLENVKLWVTKDMPLDQFKGRIVVAHSCLTGVELGKVAVQKGALAYYGYKKEMWFLWCDETKYRNCSCDTWNEYGVRPEVWLKLVKYPHRPTLEFIKALLDGMTLEEAFTYSLKVSDDMINELENIEPASRVEASMIKVCEWAIKSNQVNQVLYVNKGGSTEMKQKPSNFLKIIGALALGSIGLLMMSLGGGVGAGKEVFGVQR